MSHPTARERRSPRPGTANDVLDEWLERRAAAQHWVLTLDDLRAAGLSDDAVRHRVLRHRLHPVHRGVYAYGRAELSVEGRYLAAVRAAGDGAVLSHRGAAALWGLRPDEDGVVDVTVPRPLKSRAGIRVHVVGSLSWKETTVRRGVPVTTATRTVLDLAGVVAARDLRRAVGQGLVERRTSLGRLLEQLDRGGRRRGAARLRRVLATAAPTRSELEDRLLALVHAAGLPTPVANARVGPYEVDLLFPDRGVVVEADGHRYHDNALARADDRRKEAALLALGYVVVRVTWRDVVQWPERTIARLRTALRS